MAAEDPELSAGTECYLIGDFFLLSGHSINVRDFCRETFTFELKRLLFSNHSLFNVEKILFFKARKISKMETSCFENHIE